MRKYLPVIVISIFALIGAGLFALKYTIESRISPSTIETQLSSLTKMTVKVREVKATLSGRLFLNKVTVLDNEKQVLYVERLVAGVHLWDLFQKKLAIEELGLDSPSLFISHSDLTKLTSRLRPQAKAGTPLRIIVQKGTIDYESPQAVHLSLKQIEGSIRTNGQTYEGNFEAEGDKEWKDSYKISGRWSPLENTLSLTAKQIPLKLWKSLVAPRDLTALEGKGSLQLTATGTFPNVTLKGTVELKDGSINKFPIQELKSAIELNRDHFNLQQFTLTIGDGRVEGKAQGKWPAKADKHYTISAEGDIKGIAMEKLSLPDIPIPVEGPADGSFSLESKNGKTTLEGKIKIPKGKFINGPEFALLTADFKAPYSEFYLSNGEMTILGGQLKFGGELNKAGNIFFNFSSSNLNLSDNQWFKKHNIIFAEGGTIGGSIKGKLHTVNLSGNIKVPEITYKDKNQTKTWNQVSLNINADIHNKEALIPKILLSANNQHLPLSGHLKWSQDKAASLTIKDINLTKLGNILQLPPYLKPIDGLMKANISFLKQQKGVEDLDNRGVKGDLEVANGVLAGQRFNSININFNETTQKELLYTGTLLQNGKAVNMEGAISANDFNIKLSADRFPIKNIYLLHKFPDLYGGLTFNALFSSKDPDSSQIQFDLKDGLYKGKAIPKINGTLLWQNSAIQLSPVTLSSLSPPLKFSGTINPKTNSMSLSGDFNGQAIKDTVTFIPYSNQMLNSINGKLYGNLKVNGSFSTPELSFTGKVKEIYWDNILLGNGTAVFSGTLPDKLKVEFHSTGLKIASLPSVSKFLPSLDGTASIDLEYNGHNTGIQIKTSKTTFQGKALSPITGTFLFTPPILTIEHLDLPILTPSLPITGSINTKTNELKLTASLTGQGIDQIANLQSNILSPSNTNPIKGNLYGSLKLSGKLPYQVITFSGHGNAIQVEKLVLGNGDLNFSFQPTAKNSYKADFAVSKLNIKQLEFLSSQIPNLNGYLALEGEYISDGKPLSLNFSLSNLTLEKRPLPSLSGVFKWQEPSINLPALRLATTPPIDGNGEINTSTKTFSFKAALSGQSASTLAQLGGISLNNIDGKLTGKLAVTGTPSQMQASFKGKGTHMVFNDSALGSGQVEVTAKPATGQIEVKVDEMQAQQLSLLQGQFPGLTGKAKFQINYNLQSQSESKIRFGLTNATYKGSSFPSIDGFFTWKDPLVQISTLKLYDITPPLDLTGSINTRSQLLSIDGLLSGQSLATLMKLAGASNLEMDGRLHGPLDIRGTSTDPHLSFKGKLSNLVYHKMELGTGDLILTATPSMLDGRLTLHSLGAPLAMLGQMFGLNANNIQPVILIKGSPKNPKITIVPELKQESTPSTQQQRPEVEKVPRGEEILEDILQGIFKTKKKK